MSDIIGHYDQDGRYFRVLDASDSIEIQEWVSDGTQIVARIDRLCLPKDIALRVADTITEHLGNGMFSQ